MTTNERDMRAELLNTLLTTPHRDLAALHPLHQAIVDQDPRFYVHLAAWYADHGQVRDHQEMFVVMLCLSDFPGHREVGLALLRRLPPYEVARVVDFIKGAQVKRRRPKTSESARSGSSWYSSNRFRSLRSLAIGGSPGRGPGPSGWTAANE